VNDVLGGYDFSTRVSCDRPIIAERAMYWDNGTGEACHASIGLDSAHRTFYLPDGVSGGGYETYVLVANPVPEDVAVRIDYLTGSGEGNVTRTEVVKARSRATFDLLEHSGIEGIASAVVTCTTPGRNVLVERAIYWDSRSAGTCTIGGFTD
jgi:hypothetical protein